MLRVRNAHASLLQPRRPSGGVVALQPGETTVERTELAELMANRDNAVFFREGGPLSVVEEPRLTGEVAAEITASGGLQALLEVIEQIGKPEPEPKVSKAPAPAPTLSIAPSVVVTGDPAAVASAVVEALQRLPGGSGPPPGGDGEGSGEQPLPEALQEADSGPGENSGADGDGDDAPVPDAAPEAKADAADAAAPEGGPKPKKAPKKGGR